MFNPYTAPRCSFIYVAPTTTEIPIFAAAINAFLYILHYHFLWGWFIRFVFHMEHLWRFENATMLFKNVDTAS